MSRVTVKPKALSFEVQTRNFNKTPNMAIVTLTFYAALNPFFPHFHRDFNFKTHE